MTVDRLFLARAGLPSPVADLFSACFDQNTPPSPLAKGGLHLYYYSQYNF